MPKKTYKIPPFYDFVKISFAEYYLKMIRPGLFSDYSEQTHLEIRAQKGAGILAKIYSTSVVLPDPALEHEMTKLAKEFEKKYSQKNKPVTIDIDCEYEKPLPDKKKV